MQAGMMLSGQFNSQLGALVASLYAADLGVMTYLRIIAILKLSLSHIAIDNVGILAMHHNRHLGCRKNLLKRLATINQHIAGRTAHKELDARYAARIEFRE